MEIKTLEHCPLSDIVQSTLEAFADYPLEFPSDIAYYDHSFKKARVDFALSWGAFHEGKLVATVVNGLDECQGEWIAYSKSVGVIPAFRGRRLVDQLYTAMFPHLRERGVVKCRLEVIPENAKAKHVYERMGFQASRRWQAFKGKLQMDAVPEVQVSQTSFKALAEQFPQVNRAWSWEYMDKGIIAAGDRFISYLVVDGQGNACGYFTIRTERGNVTRFIYEEGKMEEVFAGLGQVLAEPQFVGVDSQDDLMTSVLKGRNFEMAFEDIEMETKI